MPLRGYKGRSLDPVSAVATLKTFFCKAGVTGNLELK